MMMQSTAGGRLWVQQTLKPQGHKLRNRFVENLALTGPKMQFTVLIPRDPTNVKVHSFSEMDLHATRSQ